jgi:hypothetical protein
VVLVLVPVPVLVPVLVSEEDLVAEAVVAEGDAAVVEAVAGVVRKETRSGFRRQSLVVWLKT